MVFCFCLVFWFYHICGRCLPPQIPHLMPILWHTWQAGYKHKQGNIIDRRNKPIHLRIEKRRQNNNKNCIRIGSLSFDEIVRGATYLFEQTLSSGTQSHGCCGISPSESLIQWYNMHRAHFIAVVYSRLDLKQSGANSQAPVRLNSSVKNSWQYLECIWNGKGEENR